MDCSNNQPYVLFFYLMPLNDVGIGFGTTVNPWNRIRAYNQCIGEEKNAFKFVRLWYGTEPDVSKLEQRLKKKLLKAEEFKNNRGFNPEAFYNMSLREVIRTVFRERRNLKTRLYSVDRQCLPYRATNTRTCPYSFPPSDKGGKKLLRRLYGIDPLCLTSMKRYDHLLIQLSISRAKKKKIGNNMKSICQSQAI